jgi:hypothetical protein
MSAELDYHGPKDQDNEKFEKDEAYFLPSGSTVHAGDSAVIYTSAGAIVYSSSHITVVPSAQSDQSHHTAHTPSQTSFENQTSPGDGYPTPPLPPPSPSSQGSPRTPPPSPSPHPRSQDQVRVKTSIKIAETIQYLSVDRKMPMADLKRLPAVESLKDEWGVGDNDVDVSPARSANSRTSVPLKKSWQEITASIREDLNAALDAKFDRWKESESAGILATVMEKLRGEREIMSLMMRRNVEDAVISTMKASLGDLDVTGRNGIIREFRRRYTFFDWTDEDFRVLSNSQSRSDANTGAAHLDKDSPRFKRFSDSLFDYLAYYEPETVPLFRKYMDVVKKTTLAVPR